MQFATASGVCGLQIRDTAEFNSALRPPAAGHSQPLPSPDGRRFAVAEGTPALATGGSGDLLSGIAGTLLAQMDDPLEAAACAAWIHGRAARLAGAFVRGTTLDDVLEMLPNAWRIPDEQPRYPIIAELPAVPAK